MLNSPIEWNNTTQKGRSKLFSVLTSTTFLLLLLPLSSKAEIFVFVYHVPFSLPAHLGWPWCTGPCETRGRFIDSDWLTCLARGKVYIQKATTNTGHLTVDSKQPLYFLAIVYKQFIVHSFRCWKRFQVQFSAILLIISSSICPRVFFKKCPRATKHSRRNLGRLSTRRSHWRS